MYIYIYVYIYMYGVTYMYIYLYIYIIHNLVASFCNSVLFCAFVYEIILESLNAFIHGWKASRWMYGLALGIGFKV